MLTTDKISQWFEEYTDGFKKDGEMPPMLKLKKGHSGRVAMISSAIAESMEWNEPYDREISYAIGLLHDVGRFPQYRDYETFLDSASIDHGDLSAEILSNYFPWEGEDHIKLIVTTAVKYHNKKDVPTNIPLSLYRWASLIRDADKIDIFRMVQNRIDNGTIFDMLPRHKHVEGLSPALVEEVEKTGKGSYRNARSLQDYRLIQLTWGCDLNFSVSAVTLKEEGIFERICSDLKVYKIDALTERLMKNIDSL